MVPQVDVETLKIVWKIKRELAAQNTGRHIDTLVFQQACKPGADVLAAHFRATLLDFTIQSVPWLFIFRVKDGHPSERIFKRFATIPLDDEKREVALYKLVF